MQKQNLNAACTELFRRAPDERFETLDEVIAHCENVRAASDERWPVPDDLQLIRTDKEIALKFGEHQCKLNHWSFSQLCSLANAQVEFINRLLPETATKALRETLPRKPLQILANKSIVRSIHGTCYTRLWDIEVLNAIKDLATDFTPPPKGINGGTGLYAGEQDSFVFLIDPIGCVEIKGEVFMPGFCCYNSEVGSRSLGISTFWFQKVCSNHIVWGVAEQTERKWKHTANVRKALPQIREELAQLVKKRDERKDGFARVIAKAMREQLGDAEDVEKLLKKRKFRPKLARSAIKIAERSGGLTIFSVVDALTQLTQETEYAGDRFVADQAASALLELAG